MESCSNQKSVKHIKIDFRFFSGHTLPWWQLCTLLAFSQAASWGMLFQLSWRSSLKNLKYICLTVFRPQACSVIPNKTRAVIAVKGALTKYWVKGLTNYVNVIFQFANISKKQFLLGHYGILWVDGWGNVFL